GFKVGGNLGRGVLNYDVGLFDGTVDGGSTDGNSVPDANSTGKFTLEARVFMQPFTHTGPDGLKKLGIGVAETYGKDSGGATPTTTSSLLAAYKTPGQQPLLSFRSNTLSSTSTYNNATIAQGIERRLVPQLYYYYGPFGLLSEYVSEGLQVQRQISPTVVRT